MSINRTTRLSWLAFVFSLVFAGPAYATPESNEGGDIFIDCYEGPGDCFFPSALLTHPFLLNTITRKFANILGSRGNGAVRGGRGGGRTSSIDAIEGTTGLNAGDGPIRYGAWASYSYSDYEDDFVTTAFDGHTHSGLIGFDFSPWDRTVFGVAFGYEDSDNDTSFNTGSEQTDGYTIAPYFAALLTDIWSIDASFGYSSLDIDQDRAGGTVTSSTDADRWFWSVNLNGLTTWNNWILSGRMGALWAKNTIDGFTESDATVVPETDSKLGQWSIAGEAAYSLGDWEPYARVTYEYDYSLSEVVSFPVSPSNDRDNFLVGAGIRYFSINGLSGNLEYYKRLGREDFDEDTVSITLRYEF
ncbi:MAG TPA: autotransporter outer membrane beta-barrel domain-containing protein [Gammaproteobacteria bacterium]|nr:autotransporter outer membrane beta-barrel domain-containing protein [Gammaproteobacteria bacterium]